MPGTKGVHASVEKMARSIGWKCCGRVIQRDLVASASMLGVCLGDESAAFMGPTKLMQGIELGAGKVSNDRRKIRGRNNDPVVVRTEKEPTSWLK